MLNSPILWFGGKGKFKHQLLPLIPSHDRYVEVFGGGASLLFAKHTSKDEVYNDLDRNLINFFRVLKDKDTFKRFHRLVLTTPFSRELYREYRSTYKSQPDKVIKAFKWFVVSRQSFGSIQGNSWGGTSKATKNNALVWLNLLMDLPLHHQRLRYVRIECMDYADVIDKYDSPNTFFYMDPPYVSDTRRRNVYDHEMNDAEHRRLIKRIQSVKGKVLLSGYRNDIYNELPWHRIDFDTVCYHTGKADDIGTKGSGSLTNNQTRTESIWTNFYQQLNLF